MWWVTQHFTQPPLTNWSNGVQSGQRQWSGVAFCISPPIGGRYIPLVAVRRLPIIFAPLSSTTNSVMNFVKQKDMTEACEVVVRSKFQNNVSYRQSCPAMSPALVFTGCPVDYTTNWPVTWPFHWTRTRSWTAHDDVGDSASTGVVRLAVCGRRSVGRLSLQPHAFRRNKTVLSILYVTPRPVFSRSCRNKCTLPTSKACVTSVGDWLHPKRRAQPHYFPDSSWSTILFWLNSYQL